MGRIRIGVSGWRYPGWRGTFYPAGLPQRAELEYAARRLTSLEINGTFYSLQRPSSFTAWRAQVPPGFVFAVKGSRFITHMKRLSTAQPLLPNYFASGVLALGPGLGQCCGGTLTLRTERLTVAALAAWPVAEPRFALQLYGAGHVGRAIVRLLEGIDCRVQWIDERESEFPAAASAPHIERVCVEPVEAEVAAAPAGSRYLVLTHSHELDQRITEAILRRGDFAYLGLIGSRTKRARFEHRYAARGIDAAMLARITCPIGVPGIAGKEPEVIAVAVVAQLLQCRAGSGGEGAPGNAGIPGGDAG